MAVTNPATKNKTETAAVKPRPKAANGPAKAVGASAVKAKAAPKIAKAEECDPKLEIARLKRQIKKLEKELAEHQSPLKVLGDIMTLCVGCKKVADINGDWLGLEEYLESRAGIRSSHGLCPKCARTLYAEDLDG